MLVVSFLENRNFLNSDQFNATLVLCLVPQKLTERLNSEIQTKKQILLYIYIEYNQAYLHSSFTGIAERQVQDYRILNLL